MFDTAAAEYYDRHVGRYNAELAQSLIAFAGVRPGQNALDVGCGPGALSRELVAVLGASNVSAVDPSQSFVAAAHERLPEVYIRVATAEDLPFGNDSFDHALAQLVVNFMADAHKGVSEMVRVTRPGGRISVATWDYAQGMTFLRKFWDAAIATDPHGADVDEGLTMRYCRPDELKQLFEEAGLQDIRTGEATPRGEYSSFADLWAPMLGGIGPSGVYVRSLDDAHREAFRAEFQRLLGVGDEPFELTAKAWLATGEVR
jgi:SAM-dependent methyltransferase